MCCMVLSWDLVKDPMILFRQYKSYKCYRSTGASPIKLVCAYFCTRNQINQFLIMHENVYTFTISYQQTPAYP